MWLVMQVMRGNQEDGENVGADVSSMNDLASNKGITILQWNCRSLYPKLAEIVHINKTSNGDICIYTESWINKNVTTEMIALAGYNIFRLDRDPRIGKTRGGGILVYVRDHLSVTQVNNSSKCSKDIDVLTLRLHLKSVREIYYVCVYSPQMGQWQTLSMS